MIRILLVDDQALFREGVRTLLSVQPGIEVVGEAGNGEEAVHLAATLHPDVVLMDLHMPVLDGVAATRRLRESRPDCRQGCRPNGEEQRHEMGTLRECSAEHDGVSAPAGPALAAVVSVAPVSSSWS